MLKRSYIMTYSTHKQPLIMVYFHSIKEEESGVTKRTIHKIEEISASFGWKDSCVNA